jgi:quercetin dioxygenase-like cupin family protein
MKPLSRRLIVFRTLVIVILFLLITLCGCRENRKVSPQNSSVNAAIGKHSQYVFGTQKLKRYRFPTHINDLVIDRAQSSNSEVFMVVIEPNHAPPFHKHDDTEQIFYVIDGTGVLTIGDQKEQYPVSPGDVVRIPVATYHSIQADEKNTLRYLCVDCFGEIRKTELTWDDHVKAQCSANGWDYSKVVSESK